MSRLDRLVIRRVVDELANALQTAIGLATHLRRATQTTADDAVALEATIGRAVSSLRRLAPRHRRGGR